MAREKRQLGLPAVHSAINRARAAQSSPDEEAFYASVAEAVWWLTMLDEALWNTEQNGVGYESVRASRPGGVLLLGIRYARNRQVHDVEVTAMQGNPLLALEEGNRAPWTWRGLDAEGVPPFEPREGRWGKKGESVYIKLMTERPILQTLDEAAGFLTIWINALHSVKER